MANLCVGEDFCEELTCAVCLDSWKNPIELSPCGHIFCKECATGLKECAVCRAAIQSTGQPNRTLVNMALQIRVKCMRCGWQGKREQGMHHVCGGTTNATTHPPSAPTVVPNGGEYSYPSPSSGYGGAAPMTDLWTSGAPAQPPSPPPPPPSRPGRPQVIVPSGNYPWTLYGLSQEEYDQIVSLFVFFDEDESGSLDRREVGRLARWLNFANSPQDVERMFNDMDADHSGTLSLAEFLSWLRYNKPNPEALYGLTQVQYNTIMMQFHTYDTNQDGFLEQDDFIRLVQSLREVRDLATGRQLFRMIDRDGDGAINLHDYLTFRAGRLQ